MKRLSLLLLVASLAGTALLTGTARASDKTSCGSKVISDWYDNGRIDRVYPTVCYRQALRHLPLDVDEYANARDVITRAMATAIAVQDKQSRHVTTPGGTNPAGTTQTSTNPNVVPPPTSSGGGNPPGTANSHADPLLTKAIKRL